MRIDTPDIPPILYEDFDFHFVNGVTMSFSLSKDLGDSFDFETTPMAVQLHFAEKPSNTNPDAKVPSEDITVLMQHVNLVAHRRRTVQPLSTEQRDLFKQVFTKPSHSIN